MRRIRAVWAVLTGRARAVVVEYEERPAAFFDEHDLAAMSAVEPLREGDEELREDADSSEQHGENPTGRR